jgi:hypothetical protein
MKISFCFLLVFCCVAIVTAQEKPIDKTEFDAVVAGGNNHHLRWKDEKYRMTVSTSSKTIGRPQTDWSSKLIVEHGSANEKRTVSTSSFGGKHNKTQEAILIGKRKYTRSGDEPWTQKGDEPPRPETKAPESATESLERVAEYRYLGKENLAGRATDIYQKTEHQTKVRKNNGESIESDVKSTYWFGEDGALLKNEYRSESRSATFTTQTLIIMEWTIDPSIVISEPVVTPAKP